MGWGLWCLLVVSSGPAAALTIKDSYSPRNRERPARKSTRYIILHTTEGPTKGSLNKVRDNGEAHYVVDPGGVVYRIIDKGRVAYHAGRSMWQGQRNLDEVSIGIEIVGYHNQPLNSSQYGALRILLDQLQGIYSVPDERVLPHSMVAYGAPNRWHRKSHRGRKRCAMLLSRSSVRRKLGLYAQPVFDPDVKAGRLVNADSYLAKVLYSETEQGAPPSASAPVATPVPSGPMVIGGGLSAWDVARENYNSERTRYVFPNGSVKRGNEIRDWKKIPPGTRVVFDEDHEVEAHSERVREIGVDGASAADIAGEEITSANTIYFLPDGRVRTGVELGANGVAVQGFRGIPACSWGTR